MEAAVAEEVAEPVAEPVAAALEADEALLAAAAWALAFFAPQLKDRQKVWPARSLGDAATHCCFHSSHSSEGRVWL